MAKAPFGALWQFQLCVLSASSIIMERNLAIFISFSRKNWSGPQTFILLRQPGKCKIGVSPLAEEMLSPQPGACLLLFTPRVVRDGLLEMQLSGPNLDKLNQTLHLNKSPRWPCARYSVRSADPEDREFPSPGHTCGTEMLRAGGWWGGSWPSPWAVGLDTVLDLCTKQQLDVFELKLKIRSTLMFLCMVFPTLSISSTKPAEDAGGSSLVQSIRRTMAGIF